MTTDERVLAAAAEALGCKTSDLEHWQLENPFFETWTIWRAELRSLPPYPLHVAARDDQAHVIELDDGFRKLIEVEPRLLVSVEEAPAYVRFFLETARPDMDVLDSLDDVAGVIADKEDIYKDVITPPSVEKTEAGYRVDAYILDGAALVRGCFLIDARGGITSELEQIEDKLSYLSAIE